MWAEIRKKHKKIELKKHWLWCCCELLPRSGFPWPPGLWQCQSTESRTICPSHFYCNLPYIWAVWNRNNQCCATYETYKPILLDKTCRQWQESLQFQPIVGFPPSRLMQAMISESRWTVILSHCSRLDGLLCPSFHMDAQCKFRIWIFYSKKCGTDLSSGPVWHYNNERSARTNRNLLNLMTKLNKLTNPEWSCLLLISTTKLLFFPTIIKAKTTRW